MVSPTFRTVPELGQLVEVRGRRFSVADIRETVNPHNPVSVTQREASSSLYRNHLLVLSSVEDDGLGEEIQVIWELEVGASIYETRELPYPDGFDPPATLDAFLDAVRWGAASWADSRNVQSPFRSGIDIEDYQLDPVVRAVQMPRVNLLIADDVGLGKTIEAGLVAQELSLRQRARQMLIICPSALQIQWQEQMRDKFGLDFRIVNSDLMRELRRSRGLHVNPWTHFPRCIASIDFIKRDRPLRWLREVLPAEGESIYPRKFDLLIVDEAHNVAPSAGGKYAIDSQRTAVIRLLEPHFEHKLFLSATPHNGYIESFTALLELLDRQRFARGIPPDRKQLETIMVRRLKEEITSWDGSPKFAKRQLEAIQVDYTEEEREINRKFHLYTRLRRERAKDSLEQTATEFVLKLLKKRLFSCPAAFCATIERHQRSLEAAKRRDRQTSLPTVGILRRQLEQLDEEFGDDELYEESTRDAIATSTRLFGQLSPQEQELLADLNQWAERASTTPDSKAKELLSWIDRHLKPDGRWSPERVIIFTEYRATQKWLYDLLAGRGLAGDGRLLTLYGGMNSQDRERVKAAFQASPDVSEVRILLATDAASEGLDLQNHCRYLIHYEIPWNPNRMEQRNGRIDRHGQKADRVNIYHFVGKGYATSGTMARKPGDLEGDLEFLMRAALKVNNIRQDLGKIGSVIATQVEEAMLGTRIVLDTDRAEKESEPIRQMLKFERKVKEQIERLKEQLDETRNNLRLEPENIEAVVKIGLQIANQPPLIPVVEEPGFYRLPALNGSWAACGEGLAHPHTGVIRPVSFNPELIKGRDDVVLVHLNHRLVQMCVRLLRAEVWSRNSSKNLHRVTVKVVPNSVLETPAIVAYGRLVILGGDQQKLHEEVITAGGILKEGRFNRLNVLKLRQALESATNEPVSEAMKQRLVELWDSYSEPLMKSLEARTSDRAQSLETNLQNRCAEEIEKITAVMEELKSSIQRELKKYEQPIQLELKLEGFTNAEKEQFENNKSSLFARVEQIPQEIAQETQVITNRFSKSTARLFPLAIAYLVPQKLAR